jgi:hypothetical protein
MDERGTTFGMVVIWKKLLGRGIVNVYLQLEKES